MMGRTTLAIIILLAGPLLAEQIVADGLERTIWGKPLSGGAIKVVFVGPYGAMQDAYELMQRFDIEGVVVPVSDTSNFREFGIRGYYWHDLLKTSQEVLSDVREALKGDWEAMMMSSQPNWLNYPEDIRKTILSAVADGRVLFIPSIKPLQADFGKLNLKLREIKLQGRFPFDDVKGGSVVVYRFGKGYIVQWAIRNDVRTGYILSSSALQSEFEYSAARAGWYLCRLIRPNSVGVISKIDAKEQTLVIVTRGQNNISTSQLEIHIRRWDDYQEAFYAKRNIKLGEKLTIKYPYLPVGRYLICVVARGNKAVLDWDAISFSRRGKINIKEISIDKKVVSAGDKIKVRLVIEDKQNGLKMRLQWIDQWNRVLFDQIKPFSSNFEIRVPNGSLSVLNRLKVSLISSVGVETVASAEILTPANIRRTDFYVIYWDTGVSGTWRKRLYYDVLRRKGLADALSNCGTSMGIARTAATVHLRTIPYTTAFHGVTLEGQLLNEDWLTKMEKRARDTARAQRDYNPLGYTLGDENYVSAFKREGRFCDTPAVWKMFREYLRKIYPSIDALNKQWGTRFKDWKEIHFSSEKEMLPSMDNPSAWVDYRMFITDKFCQANQRMRRAICEEDADACVGWDGAEQFSSYDGYDWWKLTREMKLTQLYYTYIKPGIHSNKIFNGQAVKSFGDKAYISGGWLNGIDRRYGGRYAPWYLLFNGWNSVWWWHATFLHPANGALRWDLKLTPIVKAMVGSAREIKDGIASLIRHSKREIFPIAVHYSENNWHASTIESGIGNHINNLGLKYEFWFADNLANKLVGDEEMQEIWGKISPKGHYAASSKNFYLLMQDLGFQVRTMARQEIEAGELVFPKIKVLILPFVVSLSDAEANKIRSFVKSGGLLIADYRCGLRDLHGRMRKFGILDDVFGIKRDDIQVVRKRSFVTVNNRWEKEGAKFPIVFYERIRAEKAYTLGYNDDGIGTFFVNKFGKGIAIYFNCDFYCYDELRRKSVESELCEYLRMLIRKYTGLSSDLIVERKAGGLLGATEITRFRDGDTWYFGLLPDFAIEKKFSESVFIRFPRKYHIYDVRSKHYFGFTDTIETTIKSGEPKLYASLPYEVRGISISTVSKSVRGKKIDVNIAIIPKKSGPHSAIVQIEYPDGSKPEFLHGVVYLPKGKGKFSFVPAVNAPIGKWKVHITDCISGKTAKAIIYIE